MLVRPPPLIWFSLTNGLVGARSNDRDSDINGSEKEINVVSEGVGHVRHPSGNIAQKDRTPPVSDLRRRVRNIPVRMNSALSKSVKPVKVKGELEYQMAYQTTCSVAPMTQRLVESGFRTGGTKTSRASKVGAAKESWTEHNAARKLRAEVVNCMMIVESEFESLERSRGLAEWFFHGKYLGLI
jgi:hypothetical protein